MRIDLLRVDRFRNLEKQEISFSPSVNILSGNNAQGKTAVIEAIHLLSTAKTFRPSKEREMIRFGEDRASVVGTCNISEREREIRVDLFSEKKKDVFINGIKEKSGALLENLKTVIFSPDQLSLLRDEPAARRRFIDRAISQIRPAYAAAVSEYNKYLVNKNRALKDPAFYDAIDIYSAHLARLGGIITALRGRYLSALSKKAAAFLSEMSGEELFVKYLSSEGAFDRAEDKDTVSEYFSYLYSSQKEREMSAGTTLFGPHRDDMELFINSNPAKSTASQGQQRSAVISIKLAETEILTETFSEKPVLLLDDIFSELDQKRREFLVNGISGLQIIITSCESLPYFSDARVFKVENGGLTVI